MALLHFTISRWLKLSSFDWMTANHVLGHSLGIFPLPLSEVVFLRFFLLFLSLIVMLIADALIDLLVLHFGLHNHLKQQLQHHQLGLDSLTLTLDTISSKLTVFLSTKRKLFYLYQLLPPSLSIKNESARLGFGNEPKRRN